MKVKFESSVNMKVYRGIDGVYFDDGQTKEIKEEKAIYLCETFPNNFALVMDELSRKDMGPQEPMSYQTKISEPVKKRGRKKKNVVPE